MFSRQTNCQDVCQLASYIGTSAHVTRIGGMPCISGLMIPIDLSRQLTRADETDDSLARRRRLYLEEAPGVVSLVHVESGCTTKRSRQACASLPPSHDFATIETPSLLKSSRPIDGLSNSCRHTEGPEANFLPLCKDMRNNYEPNRAGGGLEARSIPGVTGTFRACRSMP